MRRKYNERARLSAKYIDEIIRKLMPKAYETMDWLQEIAKILATSSGFVSWATPSGFAYLNCYRNQKFKFPRFQIRGRPKLVQKKVHVGWEDASKGGKKNVKSGIVANTVHACDAAHLMLWVNAANQGHIRDIVTIHDCIGCHAPDVERLRAIGLKTLRRMHTDYDVLAEILAAARVITNGELTPAPDRGSYDYDDLTKAIYAFS